jgi:RimJ/RimL family protein N-acetyltransferase
VDVTPDPPLTNFSWGDRLPAVEAPRVCLRHLNEADIPALFEVFGDPRVMRYWGWPAFDEVSKARQLLENIHDLFREQSLFQWGIARLEDDRVIGTCTLYRVEPTNRRAEIGYILGYDHWGKGLAGEAVNALLGFVFDHLGLLRIEADVDPRNDRSLRMLERMGFKREGLLRERHRIAGEVQDTVLLGLLRREWTPRAGAPAKGTT